MRRCLSLLFFLILLVCLIPIVSASHPPVISNFYPANNAVNVVFDSSPNRVHLRANITDTGGDLHYISFETNKTTGIWHKIADANITGNWSTSTYVPFSNLNYSSSYYWRIHAKDTAGNWTNSSVFKFTTKSSGGGSNGTGGSKTITIVPSQPKAQKTLLILAENLTSGAGYIICNETQNVYAFTIANGLGSVDLGIEYGYATVVILKFNTKIFYIKHPYEGQLAIDSPFSADISTAVDISVLASGQFVPATVYFTSPSSRIVSRQSGTSGPISMTFDESGNWSIRATSFGSNVTKSIHINPEPIAITLSDDGGRVGQEMTIHVNNKNAEVIIQRGDTSWTYHADTSGDVIFIPIFSGRHIVTATAENQEGVKTFDVMTDTTISIKNDKGGDVSSITEGDVLLLQVKDSEGNSVTSGSSLDVSVDGVQYTTLQLYAGSAIWRVNKQASQTYGFDYSPDSSLLNPSHVDVVGMLPDRTMLYIGIAAVAAIIIVIVLLLNRMGYISIEKLKNISGGVKDDLL